MPARQLPSGTWQARFKLAGVPHSRSGFASQADAEQWEAVERAKATLDGAPTRAQATLTVAAYAAQWLDTYRTSTKSAKTLEQYEGALRRDILPRLGRKRMRDVTASDIQRCVDAARDRVSVNNATVVFRVLSAMFTYARDGDRVVTVSPILPKKHKPKAQRRQMTVLTPDEARRVAMLLPGGWPRDAFVLLTQQGCRWGEMAGLAAAGDVDLDGGTVHFRRTVNRLEVGPLKNHKNRTVQLTRAAAAVAERWVEYAGPVAPIGDLAGKEPNRGQYRDRWLLQTRTGASVDNKRFAADYLRPALTAAGITRRVRPHDLRHSYVSWQIAAGQPIGKIAQWIGDLPSTVERTYAHMLDGAGREGADAIDRLFG